MTLTEFRRIVASADEVRFGDHDPIDPKRVEVDLTDSSSVRARVEGYYEDHPTLPIPAPITFSRDGCDTSANVRAVSVDNIDYDLVCIVE